MKQLAIHEPKSLSVVKGLELEFQGFEELKAEIQKKAEHYRLQVYTDETMADAKKDRATLRKLAKAINDQKIHVRKTWLVPFTTYEDKVKEILGYLDEPIALIDEQVKAYDQKRIEAKELEAREFFEEVVAKEGLEDVLAWDVVSESSYQRLSTSAKNVQESITEKIEQFQADVKIIDAMDTPYQYEMKQALEASLSMTEAMAKKQALEAQAEAKAACDAAQAKAKAPEATAKEAAEDEPCHTITFTVTASESKLRALGAFLRDNHYEFNQES